MGDFGTWGSENWFSLLQSVGIVGGLLLTATTIRQDRRSRAVEAMLTLASNHRSLWSDAHSRKDLARILLPEVDLLERPITVEEEEFLNVVIVHFHTGWLLAKEGVGASLPVFATDVRAFFSLPIPRAVWSKSKSAREPEFVRFVDDCLGESRVGVPPLPRHTA